MTIQEIIRALRRLQVETGSLACLGCGHENSCSTKGCAILRQAAEVLERVQTIDNCISRQATIEAIEAECKIAHQEAQGAPCLKSCHDEQIIQRTLERIAMRMQSIPAADMQEEQRWIPCSDSLPHAEYGESEEVLTVNGVGIVRTLYFDGSCWHYPNGNLYIVEPANRNEQCITYWMTLPPPPERL